jgi:hypothetical protein
MIKESISSTNKNVNDDNSSAGLIAHTCPICGLTYLIPEDQFLINCRCGTIIDTSGEGLLEELVYNKIDVLPIEGIFEMPEPLEFDLDYCNPVNI